MNKINSWYSLPFKKYTKIINLEQSENDITNMINIISIVNDMDIVDVEKMKTKDFTKSASNLTFLQHEPLLSQATYNWNIKDIDQLTMDDFISYESLKSDTNNIPAILSLVSGVKENDINEMSTIEILNGFFLLKLQLNKFIKASVKSLILRATVQKLKAKFRFWPKK